MQKPCNPCMYSISYVFSTQYWMHADADMHVQARAPAPYYTHSTHVRTILTTVIRYYTAICLKQYNFYAYFTLLLGLRIRNKLKFHNRMIVSPFLLLDLRSVRSVMGVVKVSKKVFSALRAQSISCLSVQKILRAPLMCTVCIAWIILQF